MPVGSLVPFVQLDLPGSGGLPDGRYLVRHESSAPETVLVSEQVGAMPARGRLRGRKPVAEPAGAEPPQLPIRRLTQALPERLDDAAGAKTWLAEASSQGDELIDGALTLINRAIAAFRVAAGEPTVHEVSSDDALAIRIGFGTGDEIAASGWSEAVKLPPSRRHRRRPGTEDIRPPQRMAAILAGRDSADPWELHALRARLDYDTGRPIEAAAELRAALAAFDAAPPDFASRLRGEIQGRLATARAAFGEAGGLSAAAGGPGAGGAPAADDDEALSDAVDLFTRLQRRRREPPMGV